MQENRSFDHYFGTYPGVRGFDDHPRGKLGVFAQEWPANRTHPKAGTLLPYRLDSASDSPQCAGNESVPIHGWVVQHDSWANGRLTHFVSTHSEMRYDGPQQGPLVMAYLGRETLPFYYAVADAFTICDAFHCSVIGPTMPNRLYSLSATIDPEGKNGGPVIETPPTVAASALAVGSCRWETMFERLSASKVSWKVYQRPGTSVGPAQSANLALEFNALLYFEQYLADPASDLYQRAFLPVFPDEFVADVNNGTLPQVSWMMPALVESEHPSAVPANGEAFVTQILSTLTKKPEVWAKTVVFIVYDENGGWFDHVKPPIPPKGTTGEELTVTPLPAAAGEYAGPIGLGFRVPALVVSPFSRGGYVSSDLFDHTSLLRFLETRFGVKVPNLTDWRRKTVGDLTSTLDLGAPDVTVPAFPPPGPGPDQRPLDAQCPANESDVQLIEQPPPLDPPTAGKMPRQEKGKRKKR